MEPFGLFYFQESLKKKLHTLEKNAVQRWAAGILTGLAGSHLVARCAPGLEALGVVPAAVDLAVLVEVDQVNQQLVADAADEARRVPANAVPSSRGEDGHVPTVDLPAALLGKPGYDMGLGSLLLPVPNELLFQKWQQNVLIHCSGKDPPFWCLSIPFHPQDPISSPHMKPGALGLAKETALVPQNHGVLMAHTWPTPALVTGNPSCSHRSVSRYPPARRWLPSWLQGTAGRCLSLSFPSSSDC